MSRALLALMLPLVLAVGCGSSSAPVGADFSVTSHDFSGTTTNDSGSNVIHDMSIMTPTTPGSCISLDAYCANNGNFCVRTWTAAQDPTSWCMAGKDVDIYYATAACSGGYRMIQLGGANFVDNKQFFYSMDGDGALLGVVSVSEGPTYLCDAGDMSYAALMYSGCNLGPSKMCVSGVITN